MRRRVTLLWCDLPGCLLSSFSPEGRMGKVRESVRKQSEEDLGLDSQLLVVQPLVSLEASGIEGSLGCIA